MSSRAHIRARTEIAALLCQLRDETGEPLIPYEHAKAMHEDQIISLFHRDHYPIRKVDGGPDAHWNLVHRFVRPHRIKTAEIDQPEIAKGRSIRTADVIHQAAMASKNGDYRGAAQILATAPKQSRLKPKREWPSKPFAKGRSFPKRAKRNSAHKTAVA